MLSQQHSQKRTVDESHVVDSLRDSPSRRRPESASNNVPMDSSQPDASLLPIHNSFPQEFDPRRARMQEEPRAEARQPANVVDDNHILLTTLNAKFDTFVHRFENSGLSEGGNRATEVAVLDSEQMHNMDQYLAVDRESIKNHLAEPFKTEALALIPGSDAHRTFCRNMSRLHTQHLDKVVRKIHGNYSPGEHGRLQQYLRLPDFADYLFGSHTPTARKRAALMRKARMDGDTTILGHKGYWKRLNLLLRELASMDHASRTRYYEVLVAHDIDTYRGVNPLFNE
ncbi:hypothetical protein HDU98_008062 [Podochytrium sp. JEL0797]|nr:hypothetical protein HDU98_008062 [Podochytrium sp. JEL0797]